MNNANDMQATDFRDRLIQADPIADQSSLQLEHDMQSMFRRRLSTKRRMVLAALSAGALAMAILCGALAASEPELPTIARIGLAVGSLVGLCWMIFTAQLCYRGQMDLKIDSQLAVAMVWCFTILLVIFFLIAAANMADRQKGIVMVLNGLAFLVGAATYWVSHKVEQSQLITKEHLLRIELRLSKLSENR